ncbi:glycosyl hydrolase [Porcipelethomonas sp.]|uniref:glycosyl hydrolase n=1 Tax=Porcipelethomonas sp. TaxID=2981675 RepID=UPI003EF387A7
MKKFKKTVLFLMAVFMLTGCEEISQEPLNRTVDSSSLSEEEPVLEYEEETVAYTEYVAEVPEIINTETSMLLEAEDCKLNGSLYSDDQRKGFSGTGYVTGFYGGSADYLVIPADIPAAQHYNITVCVAADTQVTNSVSVNDSDIGSFVIDSEDGNFVRVTFYGVYMDQGEAIIQINSGKENFDIDYIEITNNEDIYENDFEINAEPVTPKASYETKNLLRYLQENFGKSIITGQYASSSKNTEMDLIYQKTGKYPAIRFGDIGGYSQGELPEESEIQAAKDWAEKGGIVGFMWYWNSPGIDSSVYANETKFSLKSAMTEEDISQLGISEINDLYAQGKITKECRTLVENIDAVSSAFSRLAEEGIPVLWRPLQEAGGGWYWWGADGAEAYKWLYNLMYDRMTEYHKLDNLIWIWNGQSEEYLVDSEKYDIAAIDVYLGPNVKYGSRSEQYQWLKKVTESGKILALGECSSVPGVDEMVRDNALWSFFGLWYGEYLDSVSPGAADVYTTEEELIKMYNAEIAVTLDSYAGVYGHRSE